MHSSELQGTRETKSNFKSRPATRMNNNRISRDIGISKRIIASATFAGSLISDAASNFSAFKAGDRVTIVGTAGGLNNGDRTILSVSSQSITVDFPVKSEGPVSVSIRTP